MFIYLAVAGLSCGMWDLVPWPRIELRPPVLEAWSVSPQTTREVQQKTFISHSLGGWGVHSQGAGKFSVWWEPASWLIDTCLRSNILSVTARNPLSAVPEIVATTEITGIFIHVHVRRLSTHSSPVWIMLGMWPPPKLCYLMQKEACVSLHHNAYNPCTNCIEMELLSFVVPAFLFSAFI